MNSRRDMRIVRHWLDTPYLTTRSSLAPFTVKDLLDIGVTAGEDADRAHFSHSTVDLVFDLFLRRYGRAEIVHIGSPTATMLVRAAAAGTLDDLDEPLYQSLSRELQRVSVEYIIVPFTDTMLTDPKENNVAKGYIETLPCQWSFLVVNIGGKQASLINGQTIPRHLANGEWVAHINNCAVKDAAFWLFKAIAHIRNDVSLCKKRTIFAPNENEDNLYNSEEDDNFDTPHDFDAASGPFICSILEYLLASDDSEDPTDHLLRNGLHAEFLDADNGAHWAEALQFNSGGFRAALADLIEEEYQESVGEISPLWLTPDLRNVFNTAEPEEAEVAYSRWLKQGNNKALLDAEDVDDDDGSAETSHSDDEDEFNAGGPPSDTESAKAWRESVDRGGDEGDDEDDGNGVEEKDASGEENGSREVVDGEDGGEEDEAEEDEGEEYDDGSEEHSPNKEHGGGGDDSSSSSDNSDSDGDEEEPSDSGSEYSPESETSSSDDDEPSTGRRSQREPAPSPSPSFHGRGGRSASAQSSPENSEEITVANVPRHLSSGSRSTTASHRGRRSDSQESPIIPPERSVYGSDSEEVVEPAEQRESPAKGEDGGRDYPPAPRYTLRPQERVEYSLGNLQESEDEDLPASPDENSNSELESEEGWATAPEEVVDGSDQESDGHTEADPGNVEDPDANTENDADDDSINEHAPTDEIDQYVDDLHDGVSGNIKDLATRYQALVEPQEEHWLTQQSNRVRERWSLYDDRNFGTDGLDAEGRLKVSGLLGRRMEWIDDKEGPRRKRSRVR